MITKEDIEKEWDDRTWLKKKDEGEMKKNKKKKAAELKFYGVEK